MQEIMTWNLKFSAVFGTISAKSSILIRPAGKLPMVTSKKTIGFLAFGGLKCHSTAAPPPAAGAAIASRDTPREKRRRGRRRRKTMAQKKTDARFPQPQLLALRLLKLAIGNPREKMVSIRAVAESIGGCVIVVRRNAWQGARLREKVCAPGTFATTQKVRLELRSDPRRPNPGPWPLGSGPCVDPTRPHPTARRIVSRAIRKVIRSFQGVFAQS